MVQVGRTLQHEPERIAMEMVGVSCEGGTTLLDGDKFARIHQLSKHVLNVKRRGARITKKKPMPWYGRGKKPMARK